MFTRLFCLSILVASCGNLDRKADCSINGCADGQQEDPQTIAQTQGPKGEPGKSCSVSKAGLMSCPDGSSYQIPAGEKGDVGNSGRDGSDGASCRVIPNANGAVIACEGQPIVAILNGVDGINGTNGADAPVTPYMVTEIVDVCGKQTTYDEVLLRLGNGQLVAHFASGADQFLTIIGPGSYVTTDSTHCFFTVNSDLTISNEHN